MIERRGSARSFLVFCVLARMSSDVLCFTNVAGLQKEGAEEAELRSQLEAVQREESTLPAQIEALQAQLQAELDRVTQREGGASLSVLRIGRVFLSDVSIAAQTRH